MPDGSDALTIRTVSRIAEVPAAEWDACAASANPFVSHAFLRALEDSGSASAATGWRPQHLLARDGAGRLVGAVPLYLKSHSNGEYVFDHGWAAAFARAGGVYYPKLQACIPFTPVPGPRLLVRGGDSGRGVEAALAEALAALVERHRLSSAHVTFALEREAACLARHGFLVRAGYQFHWENRGYRSFDDFLAALSARKRKAVRKERERALAPGLAVRVATGAEVSESDWDAFFGFYVETGSRKWGSPYLTRDFFSLLGEAMPGQIVLILALRAGKPVAGALNLLGSDALYGRYWGAVERHPFLHFELCYYRAIELAIARGLSRVEAGAQGEHKIARGYLPRPTWSAHYIRDPRFRAAVAEFLAGEKAEVAEEMAALAALSPYRAGGPA